MIGNNKRFITTHLLPHACWKSCSLDHLHVEETPTWKKHHGQRQHECVSEKNAYTIHPTATPE